MIAWVVFFFLLGILFGLLANRNAWYVLLIIVFFMLGTWYKENIHTYNVVLPIVTAIATAIGIIVGHLLVLRRVDRA